jgi:putative transposase
MVTDITEHPTREGKVYCAVVLDAFSRRVVGWSIDSSQTAGLVTSALDMAIRNRRPGPDLVIHSDHGSSSPRGHSLNAPGPRGCCPQWGRSATAMTTR